MTYEQYMKSLRQSYGQGILQPEGDPHARVAMIGYGPVNGETEPFTREPNSELRRLLAYAGVPRQAISMDYILRTSKEEPSLWASHMQTLLGITRPRCCVLFGAPSFNLLFGKEGSIDKLRKRRFYSLSMTGVNFFVTHDLVDLQGGRNGQVATELQTDLLNVFQVRRHYFTDVEELP
jgi:uracil-DNA glycosylase